MLFARDLPETEADLLRAHLFEIAEHESELSTRVYERLFSKCPDAAELFGTYSRANQERMVSETLTAVLNMLEGEPWLDEYVRAMGTRHQFSYETPKDMYPAYAEAPLEALADVSAKWTPKLARAWEAALNEVNAVMGQGYL